MVNFIAMGKRMLTAAAFMMSLNWKQGKCPSTTDWLDEWGNRHSRGILCSREKEPTAATRTTDESQNIMLSERSSMQNNDTI